MKQLKTIRFYSFLCHSENSPKVIFEESLVYIFDYTVCPLKLQHLPKEGRKELGSVPFSPFGFPLYP